MAVEELDKEEQRNQSLSSLLYLLYLITILMLVFRFIWDNDYRFWYSVLEAYLFFLL